MARSLYICYFGIREPLVQTQVLPYLRELVNGGHEISLLTFEPSSAQFHGDGIAELRRELRAQGIEWHWLKYHKRFSIIATAYDIFRGSLYVRRAIRKENVDILHARVHVPALMAAIARKFSRRKPKLLFDIRGFMPEEYTDAGLWPHGGWLYRLAKRVEAWLMRESDGFVVLTENARSLLFPESKESGYDRQGRPVEVIPCCVDFKSRFPEINGDRATAKQGLGLEDRFVIVHLGALGGLYMTEEIADFLATARREDQATFALFLTQTDPNRIIPLLKERGFSESDYLVTRVDPADVQKYLLASDVALSFVKAGYATASRSPTKIPEYLACGLPVIANSGVGDVDGMLIHNCVGVLVNEFTNEGYGAAFEAVSKLGGVRETCRETAIREFDLLSVGGERYMRIYERVMK